MQKCMVLVTKSCLTLCDPMDYSPPDSSICEISPTKNTGMGCRFLLQGNRPNPGIKPWVYPHGGQILYRLSQITVCKLWPAWYSFRIKP